MSRERRGNKNKGDTTTTTKEDTKPKPRVEEVKEERELDLVSEWIAEPIVRGVYKNLDWRSIQALAGVARGWKAASTGEVADEPAYFEKFVTTFPDRKDKNNAFHKWRSERTINAFEQSFLVLLESQMLLRELASYKRPESTDEKRNLIEAVREQLMKFSMNDQDEQDMLAKIAKLKAQLMKCLQTNATLETKYKVAEHKISLLITHRTSIIELDRGQRRRPQRGGGNAESAAFLSNKTKMGHYSNLFYLLRNEPLYLAKLSFFVSNKEEKEKFAQTCIQTLYANAFTPLDELILLELLTSAMKIEIQKCSSIDDFLGDGSLSLMMVIWYNSRKQGKNYISENFKSLVTELANAKSLVSDSDLATTYLEKFYDVIINTIDSLPYGLRYLCKQLQIMLKTQFPATDEAKLLGTVGYVVFFKFISGMFLNPTKWEVATEQDPNLDANLIVLYQVLKSLFSDLREMHSGNFNPWIKSKLPTVKQYLKDVPNVEDAEEHLQANRLANLAKKEKDIIPIFARELAFMHRLCADNQDALIDKNDDQDPMMLIIKDLGEVPAVNENDDSTVDLTLENKYPPKLSKTDMNKGLKVETIDAAIKIMQKLPSFSGNTFLEIFIRMKLHLKKVGNEELGHEVHNVIANLQKLAKNGMVSADDGYNGFLVDIQKELAARIRRRIEQTKEITKLEKAIEELKSQEEFLNTKINDFEAYLSSVRNKLEREFQRKEKLFSYKKLTDKKLNIIYSTELNEAQQSKVKFRISQESVENFLCRATLKNVPLFKREFQLDLSTLLEAKENGLESFDTGQGMELNVQNTLVFLNKNFYGTKK